MESSSSSFPLPPMQYVINYESNDKSTHPRPPQPLNQPDGFTMFGQKVTPVEKIDEIIPTLASQNINQVFNDGFTGEERTKDTMKEMKSINLSLVLKYLDLLEILIKNPDSQDKIENACYELKNLFENMHYLINRYRPHQARETLITLMGEQSKSRENTSNQLKKLIEIIKHFKQESIDALGQVEIEETEVVNQLRLNMLENQPENLKRVKEVVVEWENENMHDQLMQNLLLDKL